jgi:Asp/Glu/hydantoin racemase
MVVKYRQKWDSLKGHPVLKEIDKNESWGFDFGEDIGMLLFGQWFPAIRYGHPCYVRTFDFPIRLKFIQKPLLPQEADLSEIRKSKGWNLEEWVKSAQELENEGVKAIVTGCGMTGTMQKDLSQAVNIPVFTSTIQFIPQIYYSMKKDKKIGILTASSKLLTRWDNLLFRMCEVDPSIPVIIEGMTENKYCEVWWSQLEKNYDSEKVGQSFLKVAEEMLRKNPDIGAIVCECTEMPLYTGIIREKMEIPVFDANDMIEFVYQLVSIKKRINKL